MKITRLQSNLIKASVALLALAYMVYRLVIFEHWDEAWPRLAGALRGHRYWFLILAMLLIYVNFSCEALKWKRLVNRLERVTYLRAMAGVLSSLAMAVTTPNRIGDVVTRGLILNQGNRFAGSGLTLICVLAQMVVTVTVGFIGAATYLPSNEYLISDHSHSWIFTLSVAFATGMILIVLFFAIDRLSAYFQKYRWLKVFHSFLHAMQGVSGRDKAYLLVLSLMKYLTYMTQYYLVLHFFDIRISFFEGVAAVAIILLILHFVPVPTVGDLGIRGSIAILILGPYTTDVPAIVFTTFTIWIINIMIPALIGLILLRKIKLETHA